MNIASSQHYDLLAVLSAIGLCGVGSYVAIGLSIRSVRETGWARLHWGLLTAIISGLTIWATHFVTLIGYHPQVRYEIDGIYTLASGYIAIIGSGAAMVFACASLRHWATLGSGLTFGLTMAGMHYTAMAGYHFEGTVVRDASLVAASVLLGCIFAVLAVLYTRSHRRGGVPPFAVLCWTTGIVSLNLAGMASLSVAPLGERGRSSMLERDFSEIDGSMLVLAIVSLALLVIGVGLTSYLTDRHAQADSRRALNFQARHDPLTGLANRRAFSDALSEHCRALRHGKGPFALLMIDLDGFKPVNDSMGHQAGDEVLGRVAGRLRCAARTNDLVARIGGDEFAILARGVTDDAAAHLLADRIVEVVSRPFIIGENVADLGASIGISLAPRHADDTETLVNQADFALYSAKRQGKGHALIFDDDLREAIDRRRQLEAELRRASVREAFEVVYQPIVDARNDAVIGAEALVRWNCPGHGYVPPAEFIPLAEELGLIGRIGASVLRTACNDARFWPPEIKLSVNLSPVQIVDPRLVTTVTRVLAETHLDPARLELEITETALLGDDEAALQTLRGLVALGVRVSLDDFGTGYSSLSYLHRFPISRIKIDRSFVSQLPGDQGSASIVRAIAQLGKSLDMAITAEGIETAEQMQFIAREGCDNAQGYLLGKPLDRVAFARQFRAPDREQAA